MNFKWDADTFFDEDEGDQLTYELFESGSTDSSTLEHWILLNKDYISFVFPKVLPF
jgi:hypothetical protein